MLWLIITAKHRHTVISSQFCDHHFFIIGGHYRIRWSHSNQTQKKTGNSTNFQQLFHFMTDEFLVIFIFNGIQLQKSFRKEINSNLLKIFFFSTHFHPEYTISLFFVVLKNFQLHFNERFHFDLNILVTMTTLRQWQQHEQKEEEKKTNLCQTRNVYARNMVLINFNSHSITIKCVVSGWFRFHFYYYYCSYYSGSFLLLV